MLSAFKATTITNRILDMDKLCLLFPRFTRQHLVKDVFLFAWYLSQQTGLRLEVVYDCPEDVDFSSHPDCDFVNLRSGDEFNSLKSMRAQQDYLRDQARHIQLLMLFHLRWYSLLLARCYKRQHQAGFVYIKGDMSRHESRALGRIFSSPKQLIKRIIIFCLLPAADLISVETTQAYQLLNASKLVKKRAKKIIYLANGIEPAKAETLTEPKQNILLNVARIGSYEKNSEFLLQLLAQVDLKQWQMIFLGTIEPAFHQYLNGYFQTYPHLRDKIQFKGHIEDKAQRNYYYQIARVFLFSSYSESFGLALLEAAYFNNYLLSTDVGVAKDLLQHFNCSGEIIDLQLLPASQQLQRIIDHGLPTPVANNLQPFHIEHLVSHVAQHFATR